MMHYIRLTQLPLTDSASHAITIGCCHIRSQIQSYVLDYLPLAPYPVDNPFFHSLRLLIVVFESLAQSVII